MTHVVRISANWFQFKTSKRIHLSQGKTPLCGVDLKVKGRPALVRDQDKCKACKEQEKLVRLEPSIWFPLSYKLCPHFELYTETNTSIIPWSYLDQTLRQKGILEEFGDAYGVARLVPFAGIPCYIVEDILTKIGWRG